MREVLLGLRRPVAAIELFGAAVPLAFGAEIEERSALSEGAAWLPAPWESILEVEGRDAAGFLQALLTQDVAGMSPGLCRPAALADRKGHVLADLWVLRLADRFLLRVRGDRLEPLVSLFDRHRITESVDWRRLRFPEAGLLLGPRSAEALALFGIVFREGEVEGGLGAGGAWLRMRETGPSEFLVALSQRGRNRLLEQLARAQDRPLPHTVGWSAFNEQRIVAGTPWFGLDGDETRLVPEMLPPDRISYTKGCYLGQETIARIHHLGAVNWRITRVSISTDHLPAPGAEIVDGSGARVGWMQSAALRGKVAVAGLAYLHRRIEHSRESICLKSGEVIVVAPDSQTSISERG